MKTNTTITDTFLPTRAAIAQRILASSLATALRHYDIVRLQNIAADPAACGSYSVVACEFRRADTSVSLDVEDSGAWEVRDLDRLVDADGNRYSRVTLAVKINYPSHGSATPAVAMARLHLCQQVAMLAAEIVAEFCSRRDIFKLTQTAAQIADDKARREATEVARRVALAVDANCKFMKVGTSSKTLTPDLVAGIPTGTYVNERGTKRYVLNVTEGAGANLTRTV